MPRQSPGEAVALLGQKTASAGEQQWVAFARILLTKPKAAAQCSIRAPMSPSSGSLSTARYATRRSEDDERTGYFDPPTWFVPHLSM
jgi:hypothetical protein